jgi:hypothetical protein
VAFDLYLNRDGHLSGTTLGRCGNSGGGAYLPGRGEMCGRRPLAMTCTYLQVCDSSAHLPPDLLTPTYGISFTTSPHIHISSLTPSFPRLSPCDLLSYSDLYEINLGRYKKELSLARKRSGKSCDSHLTHGHTHPYIITDSTASQVSVSREQSVEVIHLDVLRTFPTLGFFKKVCEWWLGGGVPTNGCAHTQCGYPITSLSVLPPGWNPSSSSV